MNAYYTIILLIILSMLHICSIITILVFRSYRIWPTQPRKLSHILLLPCSWCVSAFFIQFYCWNPSTFISASILLFSELYFFWIISFCLFLSYWSLWQNCKSISLLWQSFTPFDSVWSIWRLSLCFLFTYWGTKQLASNQRSSESRYRTSY